MLVLDRCDLSLILSVKRTLQLLLLLWLLNVDRVVILWIEGSAKGLVELLIVQFLINWFVVLVSDCGLI